MDTYSIGIDLGTNSSGIAVIGEDFKLKKYKGKNVWSVMKFDSAETAEGRRLKRGARRLNERRKKRIINLNSLLSEEVLKKDSSFFHRLEDSFKHLDDRRDKESKYNLFIEKDFNDEDYYREYKTIYHLRNELVETKEQKDIRLVYLALHHILKYRGNFLYEGQDFSNVLGNKEETFKNLINKVNLSLGINIVSDINKILKILKDNEKTNSDKVKELKDLEKYNKEDKVKVTEIFNGIVGLQFNIKKIYSDVDFGEIEKIKISDEDIDTKIEEINEILSEDEKSIFDYIKEIYSLLILENILGESKGKETKNISKAMIEKYEKFRKDLNYLKLVIKKYGTKEDYFTIFKDEEEGKVNYSSYINSKIKGENIADQRIIFYKKIKEIIKEEFDEECRYILNEIEKDRFLIKINTTVNSYLPYQVHEIELKKILENQEKYYPALKENKEKILAILRFRIPYYVGPLGKEGSFRWMERNEGKEKEKIYPWNFKEVVDIDKSAEEFIVRMTSYCSYIPEEKVLPINSILYTEYCYYDEINKVRFDGKLLDSKSKEKLKKELFLKKKEVTESDLLKWYNAEMPEKVSKITGVMGDEKILANLKSIKDFTKIYGRITSENIEEIEKIIYWLTVFEDKKIVKRKLKKETKLTDEAINKILKLKYRGFGRLSEKLLTGIKVKEGKYFRKTIMEILKETNLKFIQIVTDSEIGINKILEEINGSEKIEKINFEEHIKPLQGSPALKKGIYQAIKQINEVVKIMGSYPENIFIEFAREDGESKRTVDRNSMISKLYKGIEGKTEKDKEIVRLLKGKIKVSEERLQLYLLQRGKCMYTNQNLEIENLNLYEIDHIIPRSIIKDNSIDNKVLVIKKANQDKESGTLQVSSTVKRYWDELLKYKMISRKKYDALRKIETGYSKNEIKGFINRQLVEVRQITKHVTNLLNRCYEDKGTTVYAIKADLVDNFKKQYNIYKNRDINDFHHAKDAYAVGVVGLYINKRFNKLNAEFIYDDYQKIRISKKKKELEEEKKKNKFGFIISSMNRDFIDEDTGEIIWDKEKEISKIKKIFSYNDCLVVKKTEIMDGQMFKVTRNPKPNKKIDLESKIPLKKGLDVEKYGYYEGVQEAYYSVIEFDKGKKRVRRLVGVPIMYACELRKDKEKLRKYFSKSYENVKIIKERIPKYQKIRVDGHEYYLVSSSEWQNAKQLKVSENIYQNIIKINNKSKLNKMTEEEKSKLAECIYEDLIIKIENEYNSPFKGVIKTLEEGKEKFKILEIEEKIQVINNILKLTKADSQNANFKLIEGGKRVGRISGKGGTDFKKVEFIYESHLGLNVRKE